jgi:ferredoxin
MTADAGAEVQVRLRVDPVSCDGVGICAHVANDIVRADSWGFPIVDGGPVSGDRLRQARAAVAACPRQALFLFADPVEPS